MRDLACVGQLLANVRHRVLASKGASLALTDAIPRPAFARNPHVLFYFPCCIWDSKLILQLEMHWKIMSFNIL